MGIQYFEDEKIFKLDTKNRAGFMPVLCLNFQAALAVIPHAMCRVFKRKCIITHARKTFRFFTARRIKPSGSPFYRCYD